MREADGNPWEWDEEDVLARVFTSKREAINRFGPRLGDMFEDRHGMFGSDSIITFKPSPGRPYWLVYLPAETLGLLEETATKLLHWAITMVDFEYDGVIVLPRPEKIGWTFAKKALATALDAEHYYGDGEMRSLGDRFVVVHK